MRNSWIPRVVALVVFFTPDVAFGRTRWPERDGRPVLLHPRRFGQEHPPEINQLSNACPPGVGTCATLAGGFISTILANAAECAQQDAADGIIGQLKLFSEVCASSLVDWSIRCEYAV